MKRLALLAAVASHAQTLVLIPGSFNGPEVYEEFRRYSTAKVRVVELPLRLKNPTVEAFADHVLRETRNETNFYIGGHSIGGMVAIEIAGRSPKGLKGVIAVEGWTHHLVQAEAFGGDRGPMPERARDLRERITRTLTEAERKQFATAWRKWDGAKILASTHLPVLSIWGDRGRERPSRALLRVPERDNIFLHWVKDSGHSILVEAPREAARAVDGFIASNMFAARHGGVLAGRRHIVYQAVEGKTGFNMHPYIAWHAGRFWAMWSTNRIRDLQSGQYVRFATSRDGVRWSEARALTPSEEGYRTFARGLWVRDGELIALAAGDEAVRPLFGPGLTLLGYRWNGQRFETPIVIARDAINNFPPRRTARGDWLMSKRDHRMNVSMLRGGGASATDWETIPIEQSNLDEPEWWTAANGDIHIAFRDGARSRRLYRSINFAPPVRTNYPDAMAKFNVLRLSDGRYAMASNTNTDGTRIPLSLSLSEDGVVFDTIFTIRDEPTMYRYSGKDPGYRGYHYPQLLERGGFLYVIHAENMEDIVVKKIPFPLRK
jgi:pimeloyl-ACP methyl ester carboxylesterase